MTGTESSANILENVEKKFSPELEAMLEELKTIETEKAGTTELAVFRNKVARKYLSEGRLKESMEQFSNALDINKATENPDLGSMIESLRGIGDVHFLAGDIVEALKAKVCACEILDDVLPLDPLTADVYREIGLLYTVVSRNNEALGHFIRAATILEDNGCKTEPLGSIYESMSTLYGKLGDRKNKTVYHIRAERMKKSQ